MLQKPTSPYWQEEGKSSFMWHIFLKWKFNSHNYAMPFLAQII